MSHQQLAKVQYSYQYLRRNVLIKTQMQMLQITFVRNFVHQHKWHICENTRRKEASGMMVG